MDEGAGDLRRFLGQARAGEWGGDGLGGGSALRGHLGGAGQEEAHPGGDDAECVCVCLCGSGEFSRCFGSASSADGERVDPNAAPVYDAKNHSLVLFDRGDEISVQAGRRGFASCWSQAGRWRSRLRGTGRS